MGLAPWLGSAASASPAESGKRVAIERADRVVMIENGSVTERGTHAELIAAGGRYAAMHRAS